MTINDATAAAAHSGFTALQIKLVFKDGCWVGDSRCQTTGKSVTGAHRRFVATAACLPAAYLD